MQKKKLLQAVAKPFKPKDQPLLSCTFLRAKSDPSSCRLFQLYDRCLVYYTTTDKKEPSKRIVFDFDLVFELLRGNTEEEVKKRSGVPFGLKFERGEDTFEMFSDDVARLKEWRDVLGKRLNQRGFHQLFKPIKKIGKGNFASVYLAIRLEDQRKFAIKAFSKEATYSEDKGKESLVNEIELMRKFNHKNLMKIYEVYESQNSIYVGVELLQGGQLYDKFKSKQKFTCQQITCVLKGLLLGLQHMHSKRIMHRDLKPENILLRKDNDFDCVIADFGLATWADQPEYLFVRCGTPGYVAPEIVNIKDLKAKCDPICDLFSLGVISHIMMTGKSPFPGKTYNQVLAQNRACQINFDSEECQKLPDKAVDLLRRMLDKNPKSRISASQALKHPFFTTCQQNKLPLRISSSNSQPQPLQPQKNPHNKTSIMGSPLMTSSNPIRKQNPLLKDDSCVKFKMKENIMTGKTEAVDSTGTFSPQLAKKVSGFTGVVKESRFKGTAKENQGE